MSDPRDDLAALIHTCQANRPQDCAGPTSADYDKADAIIGAGWKSPDQVDEILNREWEQR